jgi:NADH-quinone oxidoreductase subunit M
MPKLAFFMVLFTFSSIGLPGLNGFVSEFLTILGAFTSDYLGWRFGALAALGIILGAVYMLHMVARVIFGPLKVPGHEPAHDTASSTDTAGPDASQPAEELPTDIGPREVGLLIPLALAVVLLGVAPRGIMNSMRGPIDLLRNPVAVAQNIRNTALAGATNPPAPGR